MTAHRIEQLSDDVRVILADCAEILPTLGHFDALVCDPPYGLGDKLKIGGFKKWPLMRAQMKNATWDNAISAVIPAAIEMAEHAIIWGGNYYDLPPRRGWLIWDKVVRNFSSGHVEMAWTTIDQPTRAFNYAHGELASEGKFHPTQKPLPLMAWCLGFLPNARTILDPFCGSGTTGVAAVQMGKAFTGIEISEAYFDIACRRISDELRRPRLDLGEPPAKPVQMNMLEAI